ncbi:MAG: aminopeptidase P family protein [Deltaproteobacteria bacterium]|nr:aminopeptidase P family protein [Deltaproteobacteria bacterium]
MNQQSISRIMHRAKVEAILFLSLENIRYLCGFSGSDGVLVISGQERTFLSDSRYEEQAREEIHDANFKKYKQKIEGLARFLGALGIKRLGIESNAITYEDYRKLQEKLPRISFVPLAKEIGSLRVYKGAEELEKIRRAIRIASGSFTDTLSGIKPGVRERMVAENLECRLIRRGSHQPAFNTVVASGPRAALPHGVASDKPLQKGETVVVDFGACFQGYHSDETMTLILGKPDAQQRKIYEIVRRAQEKALKAIRPGVSFRRIDAAAREFIVRAGFGKYFGHGTGHGIGLAVHEAPSISPKARGVAQEGMVFTVEPGIYIPGWGGVRLEDIVRVTGQGCEKLTGLSKDLEENILVR